MLAACGLQPNRAPVVQRLEVTPSGGTAPLVAQVRWSVGDPDGNALTCRLDVDGDGTFDYSQTCGQSGLSHTYTSPGTFAVRLEASDGQEHTLRVVSITVNTPPAASGPGNLAPQISSLNAEPASGYAPFSTRLRWSITDPNNDPLTCRLDLDGDGAADQAISPCTSGSSLEARFGVGRRTVTLTAEDGRGLRTSRTLDLEVGLNPLGPDLFIQKVEWGQGIVKSDLKLVADKPALLRVHLLADRTGLSAALRADVFRNNVQLGTLSLSGPAAPPTEENPADLGQSFSAVLPAEWVQGGLEVRLSADPANQVTEANEANNALTLRPALMSQGTTLYVTVVPVVTPNGGSPTIPDFRPTLMEWLPVRDVAVFQRSPYSFGQNISNDAGVWSKLLQEIATLRTLERSPRYYYGFVNTPYGAGIAGLGYVGWPASVGWTRSSAPQIMAHELGHNFGRSHSPCAVSDPDPGYPYAGAALGTWGFSLYGLRPAGQQLVNPSSFRDVMSYCNPQWVSDHTYTAMQRFLEANPPQAQASGGGVSLMGAQEVLLVRGVIRSGRVSLEPLQRLAAPLSLPEAGRYLLRLETASGVRTYAFSTQTLPAPHGFSGDEEHFVFTLPDPGGVNSLEIIRDGTRLFRQEAGLRPLNTADPGVRLSESGGEVRLTWLPSVFPYASVAHLGDQRTTLALSLTGGEAQLPAQGLPPGGKFEVSLSDGLKSQRYEFSR